MIKKFQILRQAQDSEQGRTISNFKFQISGGFTLIELLVAMAILAILSTIVMVSFKNSQIKARDAQRKSDLGQTQRALELYLNDYGSYPLSSAGIGGEIKIDTTSFSWKTSGTTGEELTDGNTTYMKEIVGDPTGNPNYCYKSDGTTYQIYAKLENGNDPKIGGPYSCGGESYNYGVASPNETP